MSKKKLSIIKVNANHLEQELSWLSKVIDTRFTLYFGHEAEYESIYKIEPPSLDKETSNWSKLVSKYSIGFTERLAIILALVPHLEPNLLDIFFTKNKNFDRLFTEFGGQTNGIHKGLLPTGETLFFLLAANDLQRRIELMRLFKEDHYFKRDRLLLLETVNTDDPLLSGRLIVTKELLSYLTDGEILKPVFGKDFPAETITTSLEWSDLILDAKTLQQINEIETWIEHGDTLLNEWGMSGKVRPGYRALFYGKPGTGKTMTACLLGKAAKRDVYRIDLSLMVSKYIGETEKNLSKVFEQALSRDSILFFDEADALFGKRSQTRSSNDRYANQEVAYLLQRIETFAGIVILATNFRTNIDEAFSRRFEAMIEFPIPGPEDRLRIWQQGFSPKAQLSDEIALQDISRKYELCGGEIINVIRFVSLQALSNKGNEITLSALMKGIKKELVKGGKLV